MTDQANTTATSANDITPTEADLARDLRADLVALVEGREISGGQEEYQMARAGIVRAIAAEAELKQLKTSTYCAYCGHTEPIDGDGSLIAEHIRTCEKHPMRAVEARVKELEAELQRLREDAEDQRLEWQFRDTYGE